MNLEKLNNDPSYLFAKVLADKKTSMDEIELQLSQKVNDKLLIAEIIKQLKKERYEVQQKKGLRKLVVGSFLLLSGAVVTIFNFHADQSFTYIMYGSSCVGITFVVWGLYEIVG